MRAVIHEDDPYFTRATTAWNAFGFQLDVNWRTLSGATREARRRRIEVRVRPRRAARSGTLRCQTIMSP
ncbi:MAG TPA: hypothetical protein VIV11_38790, partial [Kofleriaceae bacterium]